MELKRPRPLDDPPAASSSEEEQSQSEPEEDEEEEEVESEHEKVEESQPEEEDESEDDEEEEDEKKNTQMKKTAISAINDNPQSSSSSETEDSDSQKSPRVSDFTVKPIAQPKSVEQQTPVSKPGKRRLENGKASEPKKAKAATPASGEEDGGGKKGAINRLWSEEDEIAILEGVVEFQSEMGKDLSTHQVEFYEFIKGSLGVAVSKSQLMDKVRRLKKKYKNNVEKSINGEDPVFSKPHDYKSFQLSKKIWGNQKNSNGSTSANADDDHVKPISSKKSSAKKSSASNKVLTVYEGHVKPISAKKSSASDKVVTVDEDHVKPISSKKSSVAVSGDTGFATKKEHLANGNGEKVEVADGKEEDFAKLYPFLMNGVRFNDMPNVVDAVKSGISLVGSSELKELNSKWKKLSMAEAEISLKRMDLMQELTRMVLDAMKSSES